MMLTPGDWITIASCVLGSGTTTVIVQHLLDWLEETQRREETPEVKARNCISRHSALSLLKTVHRVHETPPWPGRPAHGNCERVLISIWGRGGELNF